jgi:hypothetical protein
MYSAAVTLWAAGDAFREGQRCRMPMVTLIQLGYNLLWKLRGFLMRAGIFILVIGLSLAGCTDSISMKNSQTGQIAKCGPYASDLWVGGDTQAQREAQCIRDFQRQGYERLP